MIQVNEVGLRYGDKKLFEEVNLKFTKGNCYGVIGANGAGKSTFLKILSGEIEPNKGDVFMSPNERMAVLKQDQFLYDAYPVLQTVIMGHERLYEIMQEKDALYMKEDFSEDDGHRAAELEGEFAELDGWDAETNAEKLLMGLGVPKDVFHTQMADLAGDIKVKVLLAQALFGNPDNLLLDEPTNHLDFRAINWLEEFLINYENTVIVVSHDRHFLNNVCTHMVDIDFGKIKMVVGNYDFWYESSQLLNKLIKDQNKKAEDKIRELQDFIARFSSNKSKAKQATSRKKMIDKIKVEDIQPSSRRYPFVGFTPNREAGKEILQVEHLSKTLDGERLFSDLNFMLNKGEKVVLFSKNPVAVTMLFKILMGEEEADSGSFKWGVTTTQSYLPRDYNNFFEGCEDNLIDWLRQFSEEKSESFIRGFLGKMLFSGEEPLKKASVLSGGEKVRCMFSKLMLSGANVLLLDDPTNHLDLESIQAVNDGLIAFKGTMLFTSHDHTFIDSIADRVIEITPNGMIDRQCTFDEFLDNDALQAEIDKLYNA